jgi:hypothetical protein
MGVVIIINRCKRLSMIGFQHNSYFNQMMTIPFGQNVVLISGNQVQTLNRKTNLIIDAAVY